MKKNKNKFYVVRTPHKKYLAHVFDNYQQGLACAKSAKTYCKGFATKEEVLAYVGCGESRISFHISPPKTKKIRICLVCEKPFGGRTKLCPTCNRLRGSMTVATAVALKTMYPNTDIFKLVAQDPHVLYSVSRNTTKSERSEMRKSRGTELNSVDYKNSRYKKDDIHIPDYIARIFDRDETKEFLYLEGNKVNPLVYYTCKRCGLEQCQKYEKLKINAGHNCESAKSSGEVIVEEFLKTSRIPYSTQHNTLRCVNPKTKKVMPYDFELPQHHIIIEVQGKQHLEYVPYFHGSEENYEYQMWKDQHKKNYAEKNGYTVLYLTYQDLQSGVYKKLITDLLAER